MSIDADTNYAWQDWEWEQVDTDSHPTDLSPESELTQKIICEFSSTQYMFLQTLTLSSTRKHPLRTIIPEGQQSRRHNHVQQAKRLPGTC